LKLLKFGNDILIANVIVMNVIIILASYSKDYMFQVILDLLPLSSSVVVRRMRLEDVAVHSITEPGLYTTTKFNTLYPVNRSAYILCKLFSCIISNNVVLTGIMQRQNVSKLAAFL